MVAPTSKDNKIVVSLLDGGTNTVWGKENAICKVSKFWFISNWSSCIMPTPYAPSISIFLINGIGCWDIIPGPVTFSMVKPGSKLILDNVIDSGETFPQSLLSYCY